MFKVLRKAVNKNRLTTLVWTVALVFLFWELHPILSSRIVAGWDLTSHYYLVNNMVEFLKSGEISGYDINWYGGYPVFTFYAPLIYVLLAGLHILTFGLIPLAFIFNLFLFLLPLFFLFAIHKCAQSWFGPEVVPYALIFALIFLTIDKGSAHYGLGLNAEIYLGLIANLFGICLLVLFLGLFGGYKGKTQKETKRIIIFGTLLLSAIVLSHTLTTIFTAIIFLLLFLSDPKRLWFPLFMIGLFSAIVTSFWTIPFALNLGLASGEKLSTSPLTSDALFILFPRAHELFTDPSLLVLPGLLLLICSVVGIFALVKTKKHFWPLAFLATLIVLPRDYLVNVFDLPIHYYRFIAHIFVLNIFLAGYGLYVIFQSLSKLELFKRSIARVLAIFIVMLTGVITLFSIYDLEEDYNFYFAEYDDHAEAQQMMEYVGNLELEGRVAVESAYLNQLELGSPHYFFDFLPLNYGVSVVPGLLAESALSAEFIIPTMGVLSNSLTWGKVDLLFDYNFQNQEIEDHLSRLGLFNVQYLLVLQPTANYILSSVPVDVAELKYETGKYSLIELKSFRGLVEQLQYQPMLFVDAGGIDFREFTREWFKQPSLLDFPVIYTDRKITEIPQEELAQVAGLFISLPVGTKLDSVDYKYWKSLNEDVVFLNAIPDFSVENPDEFIGRFFDGDGVEQLAEFYENFEKAEIQNLKIEPQTLEDEKLIFEAKGPVLINLSYFPKWESDNESQTIYWATPSQMFIFANGKSELTYQ